MEPGGTDEDVGLSGHEPFRPELCAVAWEADEPADSIDFDARLYALARSLVERGEQHAFLAPQIPTPVLTTALQGYLDLQDDEVLLAVVGIPKQGGTRLGLRLTSKRIYWPGPRRRETRGGPPRCHSLAYGTLPQGVARAGSGAINLGGGRWFGTAGSSSLRTALIEFLGAARQCIGVRNRHRQSRSESCNSRAWTGLRWSARWEWHDRFSRIFANSKAVCSMPRVQS